MAWTSPRTWVAAEIPTAATLNTHIRDNFKAIGDPWTSYAPTVGNMTVGNATVTAGYLEAGKKVEFWIKLVFGSTSVMTASPTFTLPVNAPVRTVVARVLMFDTSAASGSAYKFGSGTNSTTSSLLIRDDASASISSTSPFTWATGDEIIISATYEAS
jgi:hypothetical protein